MKTIDLNVLSKYRTEMMGLSAILILICHAPGNNVLLPSVLKSLFSLGGLGVDVFLFLSGLGIWYSLDKFYTKEYSQLTTQRTKLGGVIYWYSKRYKRLILTYLLLAVPYYAIFCIVRNLSFWKFLLYTSTLGFWTEHQGIWFVDALIPLYALSPILYRILSNNKTSTIFAFFLILLCYLVCFIPNECADPKLSLLGNFQFVTVRIPSFIAGLWIARYVKSGKNVSIIAAVATNVVFLSLLCIVKVLHLPIATSFFAMVPLVCLLTILCEMLSKSLLHNAVLFMGHISLESYMFNVTLHFFLPLINWKIANVDIGYGNYIPYLCVLIVGTVAAYALNRFCSMILQCK